ncbi:MAG: hypothetical protein NXI10_12815 [bacterium]|nr:hypothetical protein [bacterium]
MSIILFSKPKNELGIRSAESQPIEPVEDALDWLGDFRNDPGVLFDVTSGAPQVVHGFSFRVDHVNEIITGLNPDDHEVHLGVAKRPDGSHTLVLGAVEVTKDGDGVVSRREFLYNENTRRIFDYCDPCPPACPDSIKNV